MSRFKIKKRAMANVKTRKKSVVKKTYKRLDRGLSREGKIKIKKLINSMRESSSKIDSLDDLIKKFPDTIREYSYYSIKEQYKFNQFPESLYLD